MCVEVGGFMQVAARVHSAMRYPSSGPRGLRMEMLRGE